MQYPILHTFCFLLSCVLYIALGTKFLSDHQRNAGNFDYEYDWTTGINNDNDDVEVRQAGALWGISLIFHDMMIAAQAEGILLLQKPGDNNDNNNNDNDSVAISVLTLIAANIKKGISFFHIHSKVLLRHSSSGSNHSNGGLTQMRYITYPGTTTHHGQGTQALVCLSLIDFLRALGSPSDALAVGVTALEMKDMRSLLDELLPFLVTQHSALASLEDDHDRFMAWDDLVEKGGKENLSGIWYGTDKHNDDDVLVAWWKERQEKYKGFFHSTYNDFGKVSSGWLASSPYYDGESLLAVVKAAKYLGPAYAHLWPISAGTARALHQLHVVKALKRNADSDDTKGVYQWLSMSLFELATVKFGKGHDTERFDLPMALEKTYNAQEFGTWLVDLALWMVDVHGTLTRSKNTGYAYEGIVSAWAWASHVVVESGMKEGITADTARKLQCTIEKGLDKLISWQIGMGAEKSAHDVTWDGVKGLGGVQNSAHESPLRIDVTQHQMHATILIRRLVYNQMDVPWPWEGMASASEGKVSE